MTYDFIIAGSGLSGLSLCMELLKSPIFKYSSILLIDRDNKDKNDRTWSFWATNEEDIPDIACQSWHYAHVYENTDTPLVLDLNPYQYRTIQGIDFYNYALNFIQQYENVTFLQEKIVEVQEDGTVITENGNYKGQKVFKSFFQLEELPSFERHSYLLQHFKGWIIETPEPQFDVDTLVLMDYRTKQEQDTRFFYVLPFSPTKALVEYTVFSPKMLQEEAYDEYLKDYITNTLNIKDYSISETEFNAIPMTDFPFSSIVNQKVINIGTLASYVKPSSGYCFKRTLEKTKKLVKKLEQSSTLKERDTKSQFRFRLYDSILLSLMATNKVSGKKIFSTLFRKHPNNTVLLFLDERTNFIQDLQVMIACPQKLTFAIALFKQLFKKI